MAIGLALALCLVACRTTVRSPDLGGLYNRNAQEHGPDRNPIIVIPGLTGSKLIDSVSGRTVWGAFAGDYAHPGKPDDARLLALPMREGVALSELRDEVYPAGVLDQVKVRILGLPLKLKAYIQILSALGAGGYLDESLGLAGAIDYGEDHFTCFQFDYDWRRDNVENAQRLKRFIDDKREYVQAEIRKRYGIQDQEIHFDVVSHSMGGLLLRYFLRYGDADLPADGSLPELTWAGAQNVDRAVLIAPPNGGSLDALRELVEGRRYGPFIGTYPPALLGTYPAAYQLLPRPRQGALVTAADPARSVGDIFSPELWERMGWGLAAPGQAQVLERLLPEIADAAERRRIALDHQRKSLDRARQFTAALDEPATPPPGLALFLIAGDSEPTLKTLAVDDRARLSVVASAPGDGIVLRSSALMDERVGGTWTHQLRTPIGWTDVMFVFSSHLGITKNPIFTDNLLFWLLEKPRRPANGLGE